MGKETNENYIKGIEELDGKEDNYEGAYFQEEIKRYFKIFNRKFLEF